jgi:hypothetical protein
MKFPSNSSFINHFLSLTVLCFLHPESQLTLVSWLYFLL